MRAIRCGSRDNSRNSWQFSSGWLNNYESSNAGWEMRKAVGRYTFEGYATEAGASECWYPLEPFSACHRHRADSDADPDVRVQLPPVAVLAQGASCKSDRNRAMTNPLRIPDSAFRVPHPSEVLRFAGRIHLRSIRLVFSVQECHSGRNHFGSVVFFPRRFLPGASLHGSFDAHLVAFVQVLNA